MKLSVVKDFMAKLEKKISSGEFCSDPDLFINEPARMPDQNAAIHKIYAIDDEAGIELCFQVKEKIEPKKWRVKK